MSFRPSSQQVVSFGVGLAAVLVALGGLLYFQRGLVLKGSVLKVRTQAMDQASSVAVIDFRVQNASDHLFIVREVRVSLKDADGKTWDGVTISDLDSRRLFQYYPLLGEKFNNTMLIRDRIEPRQSMDKMIAARFEVPDERLQSRKELTLQIVDVDGPVSEIK